jgi:hypothetical protein
MGVAGCHAHFHFFFREDAQFTALSWHNSMNLHDNSVFYSVRFFSARPQAEG